ncbi:NADPH-dependent F420 reductase [Citricoccus sp. GCM10030269]|uniref:NADPH-dependent F420 reductase n=1 Tax=Citricoccus sp. GCM10030269 TaxID=3273388 RepID=UPI00360DFF5A
MNHDDDSPAVLNILGAGRAGTSLARAAAAVDLPVRIAASRPPGSLRLHLAQYAPRATAVPAAEIVPAEQSSPAIVVLMVPQEDLDSVDPGWLEGSILIDATNRWADEPLPEWLQSGLDAGRTSSEAIAARFSSATTVKALNHVSHWDLDTAGRSGHSAHGSAHDPGHDSAHGSGHQSGRGSAQHSASERRALGVAADDAGAAAAVGQLAVRLGFAPVMLPDLAAGRILEPDGPVFNRPMTAAEMARITGGTVVQTVDR